MNQDFRMGWPAALLALCMLSACTSHTDARRALEGAGYTNIELGGYAFFACSRDDTLATSFKATGPTGVRVSGAVCSNLLIKGATIRLD